METTTPAPEISTTIPPAEPPVDGRPRNCPGIINLSAEEHNKILGQTWNYFKGKTVKLGDGRIGNVVGVDPRPVRGGQDGNFLIIRTAKAVRPGYTPHENSYAMPDDVEIVEKVKKQKELKS